MSGASTSTPRKRALSENATFPSEGSRPGNSPRRKRQSEGGAGTPKELPPDRVLRSHLKASGVVQSPSPRKPSPKKPATAEPATKKPKIQQEPPVASSSAAGQDPASTRPTTYDEILKRDGVLGVLKALKQNRGKEFADAQQALLAARKSFSNVKYEEVMEYFKLQPNTADDPFKNWEELEVPHVCLPAEVFDDIANQIYRAHANFGSPANLKNEAATAGFLSGPFQAVLCLFGGVLRDQPEQPLPATTLSSGGRVEVEILCRDSALFYLREFKHDVKSKLLNAIAQVCCELYAIFHLNKQQNKDTSNQPAFVIPVRACLCDAYLAFFLGYDGNVFSKHVIPRPETGSIDEYTWDSVPVMQYTFGVLLEGYNNVLKLYKARSDYRGQMGDHSKRGSHCPVTTTPQPPHMVQSHTRESSIGWANAAKLGWESAQYFHRAYTEDSETAALKGLAKLYESIRAWPEISAVVDRSTGDLLPPSIQTNLAAFGQRYRGTRKVDPELNWTPSEAMEDVAFDFETPREKAVETFWDMSGLKAVHRERWDAAHPNSDSFEVLSQLSSIIDNKYLHDSVQTILEGVFGQIFMRTLVESRGIDLWDV